MRVFDHFEIELGAHFQNFVVLPLGEGQVLAGNGGGVLRFDGQRWVFAPTPQGTRVRDLWREPDGQVLYASVDDFGAVKTAADGRLQLESWRDRIPMPARALGDLFDISRLDGDLLLQDSRQLVVWGREGVHSLPAEIEFQVGRLCGERYLINERKGGLLALSEDRRALEPVPGSERFRGDLWMGCVQRPDGSQLFGWAVEGLYLLNKDGSWTQLEGVASDWLSNHLGLEMAALPDGGVVLVGVGGGALVLDAELQPAFRLDRESGLPADTQVHAAAGPDGRLWLAGEGGVSVVAWPGPLTAFGKHFGLAPVLSLVEHSGHLLAAGQRGVFSLGRGTAVPRRLDSLPGQVWRMLDVKGDLLLGALGGVYRTRLDGEGNPRQPDLLMPARFTLDLLVNGDTAWVATGDGLHRLSLSGAHAPERLAGSEGEWTHLALAADGVVWAGSSQQRVARVATDGTLSLFGAEAGLPLGDTRPYRVGNRLWIATRQGLFEPAPEGRFACVSGPLAGLCGKNVHRMLAIGETEFLIYLDGQLKRASWTEGGNLRSDPVALAPWHRFPPADALRDAHGTLWIATNHALLRLDPAPSQAKHLPSPQVVSWESSSDALPLDPHGAVALEPGTRALRFALAWAGDPLAGPFQYRTWAEGHERNWTPWRNEATRELSGLQPGQYRLHLQARDANGRLSKGANYRFVIARPWYTHRVARAIWALGGLALLALIMRWVTRLRTGQLLERTRALEAAVQQRTVQLAERAEQIAEQNRRLEAMDQARTRFFASVSHEFRTPLSLILGPLRGMRRGDAGRVPASVAAELRVMERNAAELAVLVDQILELNRHAAQGIRLRTTRFDLALLLRHVFSLFESLAAHQQRSLTLEGASVPAWIEGDQAQLQRALINLIGNAFKYSPPGAPIDVTLDRPSGRCEVRVSDRGEGIPESEMPHVFELYYRGSTSRQQSVGSGIGLALVRAVVEAHGGRAEVTAREGGGSCFILLLPSAEPGSSDADDAKDHRCSHEYPALSGQDGQDPIAHFRTPVAEAVAHRGTEDLPCVLLADDNSELRAFVARRLAIHYRVLQAGDGQTALDLARAQLPDVIVSDWRMPGMDGMALVAAVRADSELDGVGFIMVAGPKDAEDATTALKAGVDDYLPKPFDSDELLARIAGLLRARRRFEGRPPVEAPSPAPSEPALLANARAQVMAHLDEADFGVAELATALHMDRSALFRKFKQLEAGTPVEFIRGVRLAAARERLLRGEGSVSEAAYACGFESLSWFSRCFREAYGMPPGELRQRGVHPRAGSA
ncbi:ATP-binding protein [Pseudomarimonas salicorniae]|uniref:histidine kinase n=1 Tax=Pseudomarimonas salicorniae TaxID=2933270 RepID=A0ABT0GG83_9GAMM|nr:ATP-binding protein [Lysobacter sp. CAU 1642]MCK7593458.1 ATP-binding protein [Lysobacter sp. CAU 1642]